MPSSSCTHERQVNDWLNVCTEQGRPAARGHNRSSDSGLSILGLSRAQRPPRGPSSANAQRPLNTAHNTRAAAASRQPLLSRSMELEAIHWMGIYSQP